MFIARFESTSFCSHVLFLRFHFPGDFPNLLIASNIKGVTFVDFLSFVMPGILWSMPFLYGLIWRVFTR